MSENRRQDDHVLPLIIQRLDRQDMLSDEFRSRTEKVHQAMLQKLECLPVMTMKLDHVEKWMGGALAVGGGAAGGGIIAKIMAIFGGGH